MAGYARYVREFWPIPPWRSPVYPTENRTIQPKGRFSGSSARNVLAGSVAALTKGAAARHVRIAIGGPFVSKAADVMVGVDAFPRWPRGPLTGRAAMAAAGP